MYVPSFNAIPNLNGDCRCVSTFALIGDLKVANPRIVSQLMTTKFLMSVFVGARPGFNGRTSAFGVTIYQLHNPE
jgi:hypothetical protein